MDTLCIVWMAVLVVWLPLIAGVKIRDRKRERRKVELNHQKEIEALHLKHAERMAAIEAMKKAELTAELEAVEMDVAELERKALGRAGGEKATE